MDLHALSQQIGGWFVVCRVDRWKNFARGAHHDLLALGQLLDHRFRAPGVSYASGTDDSFE